MGGTPWSEITQNFRWLSSGDRALSNGGEIEARRVRRFERCDLVCALKRSRDVVEALEQRLPLERVELEADAQAVRMRDLLRLQVDAELVSLRDGALHSVELQLRRARSAQGRS